MKSAEASGLRACRVQINNLLSQETWGEVYLSPTPLRGPSPKSHLAASEVTWLKLEVAWLKMEVMWLEMEVKTAKKIFLSQTTSRPWKRKPTDFQSLQRHLPPHVDVRTVKNLKMSSKGRTDLKI